MIASRRGQSPRVATATSTSWRGLFSTLASVLVLLAPPIPGAASAGESAISGSAIDSTREVDDRGLTTWRATRHRSPSGILYPYPRAPQPWGGEEFQIRSLIDFGYVANTGETDEALFRKYADRRDGFLVRRFLVEGRQRPTKTYFELGGGSVGRSDQFYSAELGRHGSFRLRGGFDSIEHVGIDDARILFQGVGGEVLTLPGPLVPGLNSQIDLRAALGNVGQSRLSQKRAEAEVELRLTVHPRLVLLAEYGHSKREGERPFGGTLGLTFSATNTGSVAEIIAPEESNAHDFSTALQYTSPSLQGNLRYRGSIYDNQNSSLTWQNPFARFETPGSLSQGIPTGRAALAPDNQLHQISSDLGIELPRRGRITTHVAWTRMRQNQRLLPATINSGITQFSTLSRRKADAKVDQLLVHSKVRLRPVSRVNLQFGVRYSMRDSDTSYQSFDPSSGVFGYVTEDTSVTNRRGAAPFSTRRYRLSASADWRIAKRSRVGVSFDHVSTHRNNRFRREVRDERLRLHASTAAIPNTQLRISYSFLLRSGSGYSTSRDTRYYDAPGPGIPARTGGPSRSLQNFRQFDLASKASHDVALRANWLIGQRVDVSLLGRYEIQDYRGSYGVTDSRLAEVSLDASVQMSQRLSAHGFAGFEWRDRRMVTINGAIGLGPSTDFAAGSARFPLSNRWAWDSDTRGITLGAGLTAKPHSRLGLRADYRFQRSHEVVDIDFDRNGGALTVISNPATARTRFPTLKQTDHVIDASATYKWSEAISTRIFYRYQYATIDDFSQQGLTQVVNQNLFLGHVDDDFAVHVMGATCQLRY